MRGPSPEVGVAGGLDLLQLELLHTYSTFTCATFSRSPCLRDFWKITVPGLALQYGYLMRTLLAVPALHLAHLRPEKRHVYVTAALEYHRVASETARELLHNVSNREAVPLFLFTVLSIFVVLATPRVPFAAATAEEQDRLHDLLGVLKGMKCLLDTTWEGLTDSPLAPLLNHGVERLILQQHQIQPGPGYHLSSSSLDNFHNHLNSRMIDVECIIVYNSVIQKLRDAADWVHLWEGMDAVAWIYTSLDDFIPLLEWKTQEALVLLTHFAVILKRCETQWWLQGCATHIISNAYRQLDDDHRAWVYEPAAEIGWVIPHDLATRS